MASAHALPPRARRDVTNAVTLTQTLRKTFDPNRTNPTFGALEEILRNLDARTGRREPHLRTRRSAKKSAKRPAKKARARR